jgi:nitroimidazol reductase NimA-like FMN-containing flavoprotein (pyridoxamine 5'-phosphate oxidase superfamily)
MDLRMSERRLPRTQVRRLPEKQVRDRAALDALLDAALVAHVAVVDRADGVDQPLAVPVAHVRDGDRVLVHGSTASRLFRLLAAGAPAALTVTIVDGVIVARSQFESSMRYRSAMVLGRFGALAGEEMERALATLYARLLPGLEGARTPSPQERRATCVLALPLAEWSLKVSDGWPDDAADDLDRPVWAGVVPLHHTWGQPQPAPDLAAGLDAPAALSDWPTGRT